ncbi:unnamed protein product [Amoebophrya sp. A120]|nr:unnamed protein product [Amoebophrya sp. A120]|eukprot:GSA120T00023870001.1
MLMLFRRGSQNVRLGPQGTFDPPSWVGLRSPALKIIIRQQGA